MAYFARNSSGLRREFRAVDVFIFNVLAYAIGVSLVITPPLLGGLFPRANLFLVMTLGLVLAICNGLTYGLFAGVMPRSGGDYVFISRSLAPWVGFTASFGFLVSQVIGIGLYAGQCIRDALGAGLSILGAVGNQPDMVRMGSALAEPTWNLLGGLILLGTVYLVSARGMAVLKLFLKVFFAVAILSTVAMAAVFLTTSPEEFVARFNAFMLTNASLQDAHSAILASAQAEGLQSAPRLDIMASLMALPIGYLAFVGFTYSVYIGGEVRSPERSQVRGILGALIFGCVFFFGVLGWYYHIAGQDFVNALAQLNAAGKNPVPNGGSLVLLASLLTDDWHLQILICTGFFLWFYLLLFVMTQACVRILFAWSMDRLAPSSLTRVDPNNAAPYVATRAVLICSLAGLLLNASGLAFINYIALFSVCFLVAGIAAMVFPGRQRDLFERAPQAVKRRVFRGRAGGGVPLLALAGLGNTILFTVILISAVFNPGLSGVSGWQPSLFIAAVYGTGFVWYLVALRSTGVDPAILYEELPPDIEVDKEGGV